MEAAFANPLVVLGQDGGDDAAPDASVTFTAPSNHACATFTNSLAGDTAIAGLAAGVSFSLANLKTPVSTVGKSQSGNFIQWLGDDLELQFAVDVHHQHGC